MQGAVPTERRGDADGTQWSGHQPERVMIQDHLGLVERLEPRVVTALDVEEVDAVLRGLRADEGLSDREREVALQVLTTRVAAAAQGRLVEASEAAADGNK